MEHVSNKPDMTEWGLESLETLKKDITVGLKKALAEAIHYAMQDDQTNVYFPAIYLRDMSHPENHGKKSDGTRRGHEVADPLTVYLRVAACDHGEELPTYSFNMRNALESDLDACKEDGSFAYGLTKLSSALRGLADEIDSVIDSAPKDGHPLATNP